MMTATKLTQRQFNALAVVDHEGPVSPRDLVYSHFSPSEEAARSMLARLEARGLVAATYTGHHRSRGRAYTITSKGAEALEAATEEAA